MRTDAFGGAPTKTDAPAPKTDKQKLPSQSPIAKAAAKAPEPKAPEPAPLPMPPAPAAFEPEAPSDIPELPTRENPTEALEEGRTPEPEPAASTPAATSDGTPRPNMTPQERFFALVQDLGAQEGQGVNSRAELAVLVAQGVANGSISVKGNDIEKVWDDFMHAKARAARDVYVRPNSDSVKVQVSKLKTLAKMGLQGKYKFDGVKVLNRARTVIAKAKASTLKDQGTAIKTASYDMMVSVARAQLARFKEDHDCKALTDAEIRTAVEPKTTERALPEVDEYELAILRSCITRLEGLQSGKGGGGEQPPRQSKEVQDAINALKLRVAKVQDEQNARIEQERKEAEQEEAQAAKAEAAKAPAAPLVSPPAAQTNKPAAA